MKMPEQVNAIVKELQDLGIKPYLVGGALRDLFLGIVPLDYDIAFKGNLELLKCIAQKHPAARIDYVYGTLSMRVKETKVEMSLFRKEKMYTDARHPSEISFDTELEEDLLRRDFVINSMAYDCTHKVMVDPFQARKDMERKPIYLRTTRPAMNSFSEDALRMIRALRLIGRVSLAEETKFTQETEQALRSCRSQVALLRAEVVHREIMKIWNEPNTGDTFYKIAELGFIELLFSAIHRSRAFSGMLYLNGSQPIEMKLAQFACCVAMPPKRLYAGLGYNQKYWEKAEIFYRVAALLNAEDVVRTKSELSVLDKRARKLVCQLYTQFYAKKTQLYVKICDKHEAITVKDLEIGARDLIALGLRNEEIGNSLRWLLHQVYLDESLNKKEKLIQLLLERGK